MASVATVKTGECVDFVKRERNPTPEAMELEAHIVESAADRPSAGVFNRGSDFTAAQQSRAAMRSGARQSFPQQQQQSHLLQPGPVTNAAAGRQASAEFPGRKTSADTLLRNLISPEFPSQTGTPTSLSQLIPSGFSSSEGNEFATPMGSGRFSPQTTDRMTRKRALSISPLSSSSLDLNSLIRTSPTSLVNYITSNSRGSSAGSFGHLSPSLALYGNMHQQQPHARPMQVSLRSGNYPVANSVSNALHSYSSHQSSEFVEGNGGGVTVKKEIDVSPPSAQHCSNTNSENMDRDIMKMEDIQNSLFEGCNVSVKMEPDSHENSFFPPPLIPLGGGGLETVQEEPGGMLMSEDEDLMHSDPTDYSAMMNSNECEYPETKLELGILGSSGDPDRQKRIYYSYPSVEEPHNNQCRWSECSIQCEDLDGLVQHVNSDHIYRDSKKEFVCNWVGCVRERKPFKAQYMLLVHMRRHTGEKPHKCTYEGCFKAYSRLENLKTHLRSHTGERPYVCKHEGCGKAFSNASDCAKHMNRTHSDEKPYACPNPGCTKRYTDPSSRRKHMKNCQINKKVCKDNPEAMSGADEESCADSAPTKSASKKSKPKKLPEKRKSAPATVNLNPPMKGGLSGDPGYDTGGSQPGYVSGGSQGYSSSQMGYNSSGYAEDNEYGQDEISRILQDQRLSDPTDMGGRGNAGHGHMTSGRDGRGHHTHMMSHQGGFHFQSPPFQHASSLSPSQQFMPPPLIQTTTSRQLPGEMAGHHTMDFMARSRQNRTPCSSGYSSFRSSEKSPDDIDTASIISSSIRTLSTFSSNSSRVSTPCSGSDRTASLFPATNQILGGGRGQDIEGASYNKRTNNSYGNHVRHHSDEISNSSQGWTCSSQSSRYSYSGSELSDDLLDNLPTDVRKNSFSKSEPLPLPESMQNNFSEGGTGMGMEFRDQGMEFSQGFMEHSSSTMPLRHYGNTGVAFTSSSQHSHDGTGFSQDSSHLSGGGDRYETYINMVHHMSPGSSIVSPSNNMVLGNMETFTQTLSEETQYYENLYQSHVNSQVK